MVNSGVDTDIHHKLVILICNTAETGVTIAFGSGTQVFLMVPSCDSRTEYRLPHESPV